MIEVRINSRTCKNVETVPCSLRHDTSPSWRLCPGPTGSDTRWCRGGRGAGIKTALDPIHGVVGGGADPMGPPLLHVLLLVDQAT
ncbi:hypothetical protein J6590_009876 [Homalodisca vitripennis]|nr:hypothetical protein J6590_009876 [Homalodisca vitripennis]